MADNQSRRWCFTLNNPEKTDEEFYEYLKGLEHIKYFIFQREKAPTTGTIHLQGFLIFVVGKRFNTIKNYLPTAHIEKCEGSSVQNREYCSKTETRFDPPMQFGEFAEERGRTDIKNIIELVQSGATNKTIRELYPNQYMRYFDKIERIRQEILSESNNSGVKNMQVCYIYGDTSLGKTYNLVTGYAMSDICRVTDYVKDPFSTYNHQDIIVFEEFRSQFAASTMLNYLDCYLISLPCRYVNKFAFYTKAFITTNIPPEKQYKSVQESEPETFKAFERRLTNVLHYVSRDKILVEKCADKDALIKMLPQTMIDKLDFSGLIKPVQANFLPFDDDDGNLDF